MKRLVPRNLDNLKLISCSFIISKKFKPTFDNFSRFINFFFYINDVIIVTSIDGTDIIWNIVVLCRVSLSSVICLAIILHKIVELTGNGRSYHMIFPSISNSKKNFKEKYKYSSHVINFFFALLHPRYILIRTSFVCIHMFMMVSPRWMCFFFTVLLNICFDRFNQAQYLQAIYYYRLMIKTFLASSDARI